MFELGVLFIVLGCCGITGVIAWRRGYATGRRETLDQIEAEKKAKDIPYSGLFDYPPEG